MEIIGEWKKWQLDNYFLPEDYQEYINLLGEHEEFNSLSHVQHAHIMLPYKTEMMAGIASTMAMLTAWYMNVQPVVASVETFVESIPPV